MRYARMIRFGMLRAAQMIAATVPHLSPRIPQPPALPSWSMPGPYMSTRVFRAHPGNTVAYLPPRILSTPQLTWDMAPTIKIGSRVASSIRKLSGSNGPGYL